jgi:hypothetical protein
MRYFIETGFDVGLQYKLIAPGGVEMDLRDGVVCATVGAKPIRARLEIRLEDGFEDRLEAGLDHAICDGGDAELAKFSARLRYHHLPHLDRTELARL